MFARATILLLMTLVLIAGCVSQTIQPDVGAIPKLTLAQALQDPEAAIGKQVQWGGSIVNVENLEGATRIQIVSRPLAANNKRPRHIDQSEGRFIAEVEGFLDPEVYAKGREITVSGTIKSVEGGKIGQYPYRFIIVAASGHTLWKQQKPVEIRYVPDPWDPWFHSPFYRPYPPYWW